MRSGEVLKTRIDMDARIIGECEQLVSQFKPCGPLTVQLIRERASGKDWFIEINPRFGGGAPLSMKAGANSAEAVLCLLVDKGVGRKVGRIADGAVYSRFDQSVCVDFGEGLAVRGVVFDLDDTLYSEKDYVRSGFAAVARLLGDASVEAELWDVFLRGAPAIDAVLESRGMPERKDEALAAYRGHVPGIALYDGVEELLRGLRARGVKVGIVTDGRPEGQHAKLDALGLQDMVDDVIVTDELGGVQFRKPCDIAFRIIQRRWDIPFGQMVYVGDNPAKDFQAPHQLGMRSMWLKNPEGLYCQHHGTPLATTVGSIGEMSNVLLLQMAASSTEAVM